jgi:ABC-type antimicrobial peptide transport system permease subunit
MMVDGKRDQACRATQERTHSTITKSSFNNESPIKDLQIINGRRRSLLLGLFAAIALALAGTGLYGLIAYTVAQRSREIGIRLALGASTRQVRTLVIRELGPLIVTGLTAGFVGAAIVARALKTFLYGVSPGDPTAFAAVAVLLAMVSLLACYVPTRRATRIDPLDALRS